MKKDRAVPVLNGALLSVAIHATALPSIASPQAYVLDQDRVDADVLLPYKLDLSAQGISGFELGFGAAVAFDGSRMIVGMPVASVPMPPTSGNEQNGRLFVYELDSNGNIVSQISTAITVNDAIEGGIANPSSRQRFGRALDANQGFLLASAREAVTENGGAGVLLAQWDSVANDYVPKTRIFRPYFDVFSGEVDFGASVQVSPSHTIIGVPDFEVGSTVSGRVAWGKRCRNCWVPGSRPTESAAGPADGCWRMNATEYSLGLFCSDNSAWPALRLTTAPGTPQSVVVCPMRPAKRGNCAVC